MLARHVLNVMDEFIARAEAIHPIGHGGEPGNHDRGHSPASRIVDATAEILCAYINMNQDQLGSARDHRVPVGGT